MFSLVFSLSIVTPALSGENRPPLFTGEVCLESECLKKTHRVIIFLIRFRDLFLQDSRFIPAILLRFSICLSYVNTTSRFDLFQRKSPNEWFLSQLTAQIVQRY
ncbi:hypothetical protein D4764_13G0001270 [Takifugu flavidus]|uniref:Secreted protein n=1 Tax=Takifugu flavidus TaxID=433684 RepID=A0A5C6P7R7_9TELE|nr:hypothetical protein D4764_13G0001270 [Takifugu flavidus]